MGNTKSIVFPGDVIAKEEEYLSGRNTQDINGNIIATVFGKVEKDEKNLTISIKTQENAIRPKKGDIVYGKIIRVINKDAIVSISGIYINGKIMPVNIEGRIKLPVTNKNMYSHIITIGDLVRAKIINIRPLYVTIFNPELGVIKTKCLICRKELIIKENKLYCTNCQRNETRKIANDYGDIKIYGDANER